MSGTARGEDINHRITSIEDTAANDASKPVMRLNHFRVSDKSKATVVRYAKGPSVIMDSPSRARHQKDAISSLDKAWAVTNYPSGRITFAIVTINPMAWPGVQLNSIDVPNQTVNGCYSRLSAMKDASIPW